MNQMVRSILPGLVLAGVLVGCNSAPSKEKVSETLKPIMPAGFTISSIDKFTALDGVYEVVVVIDNQPTVLYLDNKLKHVISGSIVEIASKKNLTYETQMKNKPSGQSQPVNQQPSVSPQKTK